MIEPPDISWLGILPELILGLGAALVLLIDVQWKPRSRVLCQAAGVILALAGIAALIQRVWLSGLGPEERPPQPPPFGGMLVSTLRRLRHLLDSRNLRMGAGWRLVESWVGEEPRDGPSCYRTYGSR